MVCRKQLSTGEELYILDENKFICKDDYINSKFSGKRENTVYVFAYLNTKFYQ